MAEETSDINRLLDRAQARVQKQLSEYESKKVLSRYGIPVVREFLVKDISEAKTAAGKLGYPVVLKACAAEIAHKTESGLIAVDLRNEADLSEAFTRIHKMMKTEERYLLIQEMIRGSRELVMGMTRDHQFGPCVMFGIGGIFTEALKDVSFRAAPLTKQDALEMMQEIQGHSILSGIRGMPAPDLGVLAKSLLALGEIALGFEQIQEIDVNPMIISGEKPIAVDALIVLKS